MSKTVLTICDTNADYAGRLASYAETELGRDYEVRLFTRPDAYRAYSETDYSDLVLIGEDFLQDPEVRGRLPPGGTLVLTEEEKTVEGFPSASRFRSARTLLSLVREHYHAERQRRVMDEKTCLIGIFSPAKHCGKTTLALELAEKLSSRGSVLLITLEDLCGHREFDKVEGETGLSDLLYCRMVGSLSGEVLREAGHPLTEARTVLHEAGHPLTGLRTALHEAGHPLENFSAGEVTVLSAADHSVDIRSGDPAEIAALLSWIAETGGWAFIVADIGDGLPDSGPVLEVCDTILVPCPEEEIALRKVERWQDRLRREGGHLRAKLKEIRMNCACQDVAAGIIGELYE